MKKKSPVLLAVSVVCNIFLSVALVWSLVMLAHADGFARFSKADVSVSAHKNRNDPYGFTVLTIFREETVAHLKQLNVNWIRYQLNWKDIEKQQGQYDWSKLDAAVQLANQNDIKMTFPLQIAPDWALSQSCAGRRFLPGAKEMSTYARAVAERYNGQNGHGYINSFEVGNEEFDSLWTGDWKESLNCRKATFYGEILKTSYQQIKAASPNALVGMTSLWFVNKPHMHEYMTWLYQNNYGNYFDFANYHYYICNKDPDFTIGDRPSFNQAWQTIYNVMKQYGDGDKPIWVTEVGWNVSGVYQDPKCVVSPEMQAEYFLDTARSAMASGPIARIFWYTIDRENDGMSITQPDGNLPVYNKLHEFIKTFPDWN